MLKAIRENPRAVFYAVLMHLVLLVSLAIGLDWTPKAIKPGVKTPIEAELVSSDTLKVIEERKLEEERKREQAARDKAAAEQRKKDEVKRQEQEKAAAEKKKQEAAAAQKKAEAEKKKQAEIAAKKKAEAEKKARAEEAAKQKAAAEKKRKAEEAAKKKAEAEKKAAEARQREAEKALQAQLAEEQEVARAKSALAEFIPYIQDRIQRNWLRPPGSPAGLSCMVKVRLIPGGDVTSVKVIRSSGDPVFDQSVERAVLKASPLPLPDDATLFKHFREINFNFDPGR